MSLYIAKIFGPILIVVSISILLYSDKYVKVVDEFFDNFFVCYITSVAAMATGLAILNAHNLWVMGWEVLLTVFGWLILVKGALILLCPQPLLAMSVAMKSKRTFRIAGVVYLFIGIWFSLKGYAIF